MMNRSSNSKVKVGVLVLFLMLRGIFYALNYYVFHYEFFIKTFAMLKNFLPIILLYLCILLIDVVELPCVHEVG